MKTLTERDGRSLARGVLPLHTSDLPIADTKIFRPPSSTCAAAGPPPQSLSRCSMYMLMASCVPAGSLSHSRRAIALSAPAILSFSSSQKSTATWPPRAADIATKSSAAIPRYSRTTPAEEEEDYDSYDGIRTRLESPVLKLPPTPQQDIDEPLYPRWLVGRWQCTQTLTAFSTPLGVEYLSAAGQPLSEAEAVAAQARAQIGVPVTLELRWQLSEDRSGAKEDLAFNAKSRADAMAGRAAVREARSCKANPQAAVACIALDLQGTEGSQQLLINGLRVVRSGSRVVASELTRKLSVGERRGGAQHAAIFDVEAISEYFSEYYNGESSDLTNGRLRLSSYLQPADPRFEEAKGRSVSLSNYILELRRLPPDSQTRD